MGRPPKKAEADDDEELAGKTVRLPPQMWKDIDDLAKADRRSINNWLFVTLETVIDDAKEKKGAK